MKSRLFPAVLAALLFASNADAALTDSEKAQIKDFIAAAKVENTPKVRSLVARTDLTPDESASALVDSIAPLSWTEAKAAFMRDLVMGGPASTRPVLAVAATKAILARADNIYQHESDKLDKDRNAALELVALYAWLDTTIANAGNPSASAHDAGAGFTAATYDDCSKLLKEHVETNAKWLKGDGTIPEKAARIRAQAQVTLVDMMPDGLTRRVEAADRLGLKGARKAMLADWGVLLADAGKLDDAKAAKVRQTLQRMPGARTDLSLVYYGPTDHRQNLRARGTVAHVIGGNDKYPLEGDASAWDPAIGTITHDLSVLAARHALGTSPSLRAQTEKDAVASSGDPGRVLGRPRAPSVEYILGAAIDTLMTDAPKALDVSVTRFNGGQPQTAALFSDALAALALSAPDSKPDVAKGGAWVQVTAFTKGPGETAAQFKLDGHTWAIDRGGNGVVVGIRRDGATVGKTPGAAPKK